MTSWIATIIFAVITATVGVLIGLNGSPFIGFASVVFAFVILFTYQPLREWMKKLFKK